MTGSGHDEAARLAGPAIDKIERFVAMIEEENRKQNLISKASLPDIWSRHVLDSLQLAAFARLDDRRWVDIGTGAGFPGLIIAMLDRFEMTLVEPRQRRAEFLKTCVERLGLCNVTVLAISAQAFSGARFDIVSARAVAATRDLLRMSRNLANPSTRFILPKGEHTDADVESAQRDWHGVFHVEQSRTNPASGILVIDQVRPK